MEKLFIKNRKGQKIAVLPEINPEQKGLVFVMHGLGSWKERPIGEYMAKPFFDNGLTVVRFDTANTFGESDGRIEDATTTNYYEDLEDVIKWASEQDWYQEPFYLTGHSLGGICTGLYAENYPEKIKGWVPVGSVISGELRIKAREEQSAQWKEKGFRELREWDPKNPKSVYKLPWSHMEDNFKYDLLKNVSKLTMPVLIVVGEHDDPCPPEHQKILFDALPGAKEMHVIEGGPHTFRDENHLKQIYEIFDTWIKKTNT